MPDHTPFVRWFRDVGLADVPRVGGQKASLGELYRELAASGVRVPNGFAITADAYWHFLDSSGLSSHIPALLQGVDTRDLADLASRGLAVRHAIMAAALPTDLQEA